MAVCKRSTNDPLLKIFLDKYNLNLLSIPREKAHLGSLYVRSNGRVSTPGSISHFLTPELKIPTALTDEQMADVYGKVTHAISFSNGLGLLEGFFTAVGAMKLFDEVKADYAKKRAHSFRFSFKDTRRDSIDVGLMGSRLIRHRFDDRHALVNPGNRYYLVTGIARSSGITVTAETKESSSVALGAEVLKIAKAGGKVEIARGGEGVITYTGDKKLVFGVELYELKYDEKRQKMKMLLPPGAIQIRSASAEEKRQLLKPAFIGGADDDAFFELEEM
jgi:hypothetical protein